MQCGQTAEVSIFIKTLISHTVKHVIDKIHIREVCSRTYKWVLLTCPLDLLKDN